MSKRGIRKRPISMADLESGRICRINESEYAELKGCSRYKPQRDRYLGKGIPFQKDDNGSVWYLAADVLADLKRPVYQSTNEYDTSSSIENLSKARAALRSRSEVTGPRGGAESAPR